MMTLYPAVAVMRLWSVDRLILTQYRSFSALTVRCVSVKQSIQEQLLVHIFFTVCVYIVHCLTVCHNKGVHITGDREMSGNLTAVTQGSHGSWKVWNFQDLKSPEIGQRCWKSIENYAPWFSLRLPRYINKQTFTGTTTWLFFYEADVLPATQPIVSKHYRNTRCFGRLVLRTWYQHPVSNRHVKALKEVSKHCLVGIVVLFQLVNNRVMILHCRMLHVNSCSATIRVTLSQALMMMYAFIFQCMSFRSRTCQS